jgi:hypothetical protein
MLREDTRAARSRPEAVLPVIEVDPDLIGRHQVGGVGGGGQRLSRPPAQRHVDERLALDPQALAAVIEEGQPADRGAIAVLLRPESS